MGNIVLATGSRSFDAPRILQYGYGRLPTCSPRGVRADGERGWPDRWAPELRDMQTPPEASPSSTASARATSTTMSTARVCCMYPQVRPPRARTPAGRRDLQLLHRHPCHRQALRGVLPSRADEGHALHPWRVAEVTDAARTPSEEGKLIVQVEDTLIREQRRLRWTWWC